MTQQTKVYALPLKIHSRVRVVAITIWASDSPGERQYLLKRLGGTGTIDSVDPRFTLPFRVKLDDGDITAFSEDELEPLTKQLALKEKEPRNIEGSSEPLQQLIVAIGRHPAAENDPAVIDAVNAVEDALRQVVRKA